jgi:NADPH-dependent curcumin reductase CurA
VGCRAVGIAGGPQKARELTEAFGYDAGVDYKDAAFNEALKSACPEGVDVYFANVGGDVSSAVYRRLNIGARIAVCGQIFQYNLEQQPPTFHPGALIVSRARMEAFLVSDYAGRFDEAIPRLAKLLAVGRLVHTEDVVEGIENAPKAFLRMLRGENRGKQLVRVV